MSTSFKPIKPMIGKEILKLTKKGVLLFTRLKILIWQELRNFL